jgi:hypothetical protein
VKITGTSGSLSHQTSVSLTVNPILPPPDFTIAASSLWPATVPAGGSATSTITVAPLNGFTGTVSLSCNSVSPVVSPAPTCVFVPSSIASGSGTSTLRVNTSATTPTGAFTVTIAGSGSLNHSTTVNLTVTAAPVTDFTMAASTLWPVSIAAGGSAASTITIAPVNGFKDTVSLSCSAIAPSVTPLPSCSFNPSSVANGSGTTTLTVSTTAPHALSGMSSSLQRPRGFGWVVVSGSALVGVFLLGVPSPRRRRMAEFGLMVLVLLAVGMGCGGYSTSGGKAGGTPVGSYTISVTATSASPQLSHTATVVITVQ